MFSSDGAAGRRGQFGFVDLAALDHAPEGLVGSAQATAFMLFVDRGAGMIRVGQNALPLPRHSACLCRAQPRVAGPVLRGWVLSLGLEPAFDRDGAVARGEGVRAMPAGVAMRCAGFFELLEAELDRGRDHIDANAIRALVDLILLCYERSPHPGNDTAGSSRVPSARTRQVVSDILEVIDDRYTDQLSLIDVATALNRSSSSVQRAAKTVTGRTVGDLIAERRIKAAQVLILETPLSIEVIAEQVGCPNVGNFYRTFRRHTAMTPREWLVEASRAITASETSAEG